MPRTIETRPQNPAGPDGFATADPVTGNIRAAEIPADAKAHTLPAEQWATQICTQLNKSVEAVIATGRLLVEAKAALKHGDWERMFSEKLVPFSIGTAQRLMAIASHPLLSKTAHVPLLPPSWGTLYELTKVPEPTLKAALEEGRVTPGMERKDVQALLPAPEAPKQRTVMPAPPPAPIPFRTAANPATSGRAEPSLDSVRSGEQHGLFQPNFSGVPRSFQNNPPCDALQYAAMAILDLNKIMEDDIHCVQALAAVERWIAIRRLPDRTQREPLFVEIWKELAP